MRMTSSPSVLPLLRGKFIYIDRCVLCRAEEEEQLKQLEGRIKTMSGTITDSLDIASFVLAMPLQTVLDAALQARSVIVYYWFIDHATETGALPDVLGYEVDS
ncbi:hypothetical protein AURDEDRAFT_174774 [Auricularia subglabra TFB-10046 SS5]|uniref:BRCT domain-containing protein n=1 Tax=Auricularia subglabra (strain TFB-10046 / SS5) TaxID=717982 RepID=J0D908_AURST|nr:hypothetical protein AURDEDRAFT_174774 [Auricularia subglabra TFB-10046 SS5]